MHVPSIAPGAVAVTAGDAAPEPTGEPTVHAVGIGPGGPGFRTPRARDLIRGADLLVGFETVLEFVATESDADRLPCDYDDQAATLAAFGERVGRGERGVAVLMGDPNVSGYRFLERVERAVPGPVRVVPGVSSIQVAASRARTPLEDSLFVTLHRRGDLGPALDRLAGAAGDRHLIVLPRPYDMMPEAVAFALRDRGVDGSLAALVFERLTLPGETRTRRALANLAREDAVGGDDADTDFSDLSVLVVRAPVGNHQ